MMAQLLPYHRPSRVMLPDGAVPLAQYRERDLDLLRDFVLLADRVVVRARRPLRSDAQVTVELNALNPNLGYLLARPGYFQQGVVLTAFGALFAVFAQGVAERGAPSWTVIGSALVAVAGVFLMLWGFRRVKHAQFRSVYGQPVVLDIKDAGPDRTEFDDFVEKVRRQILIERKLVPAAPPPSVSP